MTIVYFSATGNDLYVAKQLGGRILSIPRLLKEDTLTIKDDQVGVVFPVYGLCVPPYVEEFLKKVTIQTKYLFSVITYGFYAGAATTHLLEIAKPLGVTFSYVTTLKMVENYLPGFDMEKQKRKEPKLMLEKHLEEIIEEVKVQKEKIHKDSAFDKLMTKQHQKKYAYPIGIGYSKQYEVIESCSSCGICTRVCPVDNVRLEEKHPVFGNQCISCLSCVQNCPQGAIWMKKEKGSERFRNEHITLQEIIAANR